MNRKALEQAPGESRFLISKQTPRPLMEGKTRKEASSPQEAGSALRYRQEISVKSAFFDSGLSHLSSTTGISCSITAA